MITQYKSKKNYYKFRSNYQVIVLTLFFAIIIFLPTISILKNLSNYKQDNTFYLINSGNADNTGIYDGSINTMGRKTEVLNDLTYENESSYSIQHYQIYNDFNYTLNSIDIRAYNLFNGSGDSAIATNKSEIINIDEDIPSIGYIGAQGFNTPNSTDLLSINNVSLYLKHTFSIARSPIYFVSLYDKDFRERLALTIQPAESGSVDNWVTINFTNNILEPDTEYNIVYTLAVKGPLGIGDYNISKIPTWKAENKLLTGDIDRGWTYYNDGTDYVPIANNDTIDMLCNYSYQKIINPQKVNLTCKIDDVEYIPTYQKSLATGSLGFEAELKYKFSNFPIEDINITIFTNETIESFEIEIIGVYIYVLNASGFYKINENNIEWSITYQNYDIGAYKEELRFLYESDWVVKEFYNTIGTPVELASISTSFYNETYLSLFDPEGAPLGTGDCIGEYQSPNYCDNVITKIKTGSEFQESNYLQIGKTIRLEAVIENSFNEPISGGSGNIIFRSPLGQIIYNESNLISYNGILDSSEIILDTRYGVGSYTIEVFWTNGKEVAIYTISVDIGHPEGYLPPETIILIVSLIGLAILATPASLVARKYIRQRNWEKGLHDLFVLTKEGVSIYNFSFGIELKKLELISGMISALSTFMKEATGSKEAIRIIDQRDKKIILNHGNYITVALVCDKDLPIIHKSVNKFTGDFENKYGKRLLNWSGEITMFKDAEPIVKKHFPVSMEEQRIRGVKMKLMEFKERILSVDDKMQIISLMREITEFSSRYQEIINIYSFKDFNELIRIAEYKINE